KDQYVALYDYAPVTFLTLDFSGVIQKCNQAAVQLFGMKSHVLTGKSLQHFIHEDSQTVFRLHKSRLFDTHANQISDLELNADGKEIFVRMESQLDLTNTNLVGCWHVALTDTTVQVNLQRNLAKLNSELERRVAVRTRKYEESRLELYSILNAAADSIITLNAEGEIVHINKATEYIFGYHKDELVGANVRLLIPYTGFGQHENFIQNIVKQTSCTETLAYTVQLMGRKKSGAVFPATISIARVDNLNRFTAVLRDDSQIRKLQREVMRVAEMERSRISRELHDSLGQELVGIAMLAKSIAQDYGEKDIQLAQNFQRMSEILGGCVKRLRQIIFELAPLELS
ncbi:MAG TPA: PAS domain S-box protein, partial [Aggregatilineales bacterium]|nr:PAS domain S-box protein [Aggregatilineales bacterium]